MRLVLGIGVVLGGLREALGDDVLLQGHLVLVHLLRALFEETVQPIHSLLLALAAQDPHQDLLTDTLGELAPISSHDVQALELALELLVRPVHDLQGRVFFLLQQHQPAEHGIDFDFQPLVPLVDRGLDLLSRLHGLVVILGLGVHEDGVGVAVDYLEHQLLLHNVDGGLQGLSALGRDQGGQGLGVEPAVLEAQAAVHRVGGELDGQLPDLKHLPSPRVPLRLDRRLHVPPALHEAAQHLRQHALVQRAVRGPRLREQLGLRGDQRELDLVGPLNGGEADVVLLDDRGVQAVEVEHHDEVVVQPDLRLQDQASAVRGLASARAAAPSAWLLSLGVVHAGVGVATLLLLLLLHHALFVRQHKLALVELVAQQRLVALRTPVLQRLVPDVARQVRELLGERQNLQGVRQSGDREGRVKGVLGEALQGRRGLVERRQALGLYLLQVADAELLLGEVRQVVGADLREQILGLEHDVADQAASRQAGAGPESAALATLDVRDPRSRPPQATHLLPTLKFQVVHARGQHIQVEAIGVVTGDDIGVELVNLGEQGGQESRLGAVRLHAGRRQHLLRIARQRPGIHAAHGRPNHHAIAQVFVRVRRVCIQPGVQRARDSQGLVGLLRAPLQGLHANAQHPQRWARRRHAHGRELPALVVRLRSGHGVRGDPELDRAVRQPRGVLTPRVRLQAQPRWAHDGLPHQKALQQRRLRPEHVGERLAKHANQWHPSRRVQHDLKEGQLSVAVLQSLLEGVVPHLQLRAQDLHAGAVLPAHLLELNFGFSRDLLHVGLVVGVLHVQQEMHTALHLLDDQTATFILPGVSVLPRRAGLPEEVEARRIRAVVLEGVHEEEPHAAVLLQQQLLLQARARARARRRDLERGRGRRGCPGSCRGSCAGVERPYLGLRLPDLRLRDGDLGLRPDVHAAGGGGGPGGGGPGPEDKDRERGRHLAEICNRDAETWVPRHHHGVPGQCPTGQGCGSERC
mmetsp:Transcript_28918/g.83043  ORF Transcript_28918/g.83043 Transcript_28918/m.83043 type:complete len:977 (+) Transcript_28918:971-3901(+)